MHVAVVSDIHGNRHAFEAVLEAIDASEAEQIWCLGDLVGYGAEPDACVELALDRCDVVLAGNHDLAVTGALSLEEFSPGAGAAARRRPARSMDAARSRGLDGLLAARAV